MTAEVRYRAAVRIMQEMHLAAFDSILAFDRDPGLENALREDYGFEGGYYHYDPDNIYNFLAESDQFAPDFILCLDTIEHINMFYAHRLLQEMPKVAHKGVVVTTPDGDAQDVFAMERTPLWGATEAVLEAVGYATVPALLYGGDHSNGRADGLVAWNSQVW